MRTMYRQANVTKADGDGDRAARKKVEKQLGHEESALPRSARVNTVRKGKDVVDANAYKKEMQRLHRKDKKSRGFNRGDVLGEDMLETLAGMERPCDENMNADDGDTSENGSDDCSDKDEDDDEQ